MLGQKLLEAVFGDQAVRRLAERSRSSLEGRVRALLDAERARYLDLLDTLEIDPDAAEHLRAASRRVDDLRFAAVQRTSRPRRVTGRPPRVSSAPPIRRRGRR